MTRETHIGPPEQASWKQTLLRRDLTNPLLRVGVALAFVLALAVLAAPPQQRGASTDEIVVGAVAETTISATHAFQFVPNAPVGLDGVRAEAAAQVLEVWDYNESLASTIDAQVEGAFEDARLRLAARARAERAQQEADVAAAEGTVEAEEGSGTGALKLVDRDAELAAEDTTPIDIESYLDAATRHEVVLESPQVQALFDGVSPAALEAFADASFMVPAEDALQALVGAAMSEQIVEDIAVFDDVDAGGVTLRTRQGTRTVNERTVRRFGRFHDLEDVDELINQARHHLRYIEARPLQLAIEDLARTLVEVNTVRNQGETAARRNERMVRAEAMYRESLTQSFQTGELIVAAGQVIDPQTFQIIAQMTDTAPPRTPRAQAILGAAALIVLLIFPILVFALQNLRRFSHQAKDLTMMAVVLIVQLAVTDLWGYMSQLLAERQAALPQSALIVLLPFAAGAMLVRILTNAVNAMVFAIVYALLAGMVFGFDLSYVAYALVASLVGSAAVRSAQTRTDILSAGAVVGVVMLGLSVALSLVRGEAQGPDFLWIALAAALAGLTSAVLVYGLLPLVEAVFRFTTPMRLMELANLNHPALKELILKSPGSYHHSMMVGQLVEAACEAVGADALLGRVGSYFHDIGKTKTPLYFAENQHGTNPHDKLKPSMSALVIKAHVKDGVELARAHRLPEEIVDFIREHHGTSLIQYFYRKAQDEAEDGEVREADYRYPGPKPRSRETAICMLADGVEAASRALRDPNHAHLKGLVQKMINKAFIDGQLDECDLTLRDLHLIAQAFLLRLTAFYHHRPEYPGAAKRNGARTGRHEATEENDRSGDQGGDGPPPDGERETNEDSGLHLRRLGM